MAQHVAQVTDSSEASSASLLQEAGDVLVSKLFSHLQLPDLQALKQCSQLLQRLVHSAPQPVLEAAAWNTNPTAAPYHPALLSGDISGFLARRAARDRAWAAGPATWQRSTLDVTDPNAGPMARTQWERLSHDGSCLATVDAEKQHVRFKRLSQSGPVWPSIRLPEGWTAAGPPSFCQEASSVALLLKPETGAAAAGREGKRAVLIAAPAIGRVSVGKLWGKESRFSCLSWAPTGKRLCVSKLGMTPQQSAIWIFDETLNKLASFSGVAAYSEYDLHWNASATGLLCKSFYESAGNTWYWISFPGQAGDSKSRSGRIRNVAQARWGAWIPGTGEVMLVSKVSQEHGQTNLTCWAVSGTHPTGIEELGQLLSAPDILKWAASLRQVAVMRKDGDFAATLHLYLLMPGPRLEALHTLDIGPYSRSFSCTQDARYLLFVNWAAGFTRPEGLGVRGKACRGSRPLLAVVHVQSGKLVEVMAMPQTATDADWMPSAMCIKPLYSSTCTLIAFPG